MVLENLLGKKEGAPSLPKPLSGYRLTLPEAEVRIRLELKLKVTEEEEVRLRGPGIRTYIDGTVPRRVEKVEKLKDAYYLESKDSTRLFLFASREASADYIHAQREGRAELEKAKETWAKERAEAEAQLIKTRAEAAALELAISKAEAGFMDSEDNLGFTKAQTDHAALERRVRDLKLKLLKPEPRPDMGSAIAATFGADEIITRGQIVEAVATERAALLKRYRGLPDESVLPLGRHVILIAAWKRP